MINLFSFFYQFLEILLIILSLQEVKGGTDTLRWQVSSYPSNAWQFAAVDFPSMYDYQIVFEAMATSTTSPGVVAIDDVFVTQESCKDSSKFLPQIPSSNLF